MTFAQPRTLAEMQNRPTAYAVDLVVEGEIVARFSFEARKTQQTLRRIAGQYGAEIEPHLTEEELDQDYRTRKDAMIFAKGRVELRFGETERTVRTLMSLETIKAEIRAARADQAEMRI